MIADTAASAAGPMTDVGAVLETDNHLLPPACQHDVVFDDAWRLAVKKFVGLERFTVPNAPKVKVCDLWRGDIVCNSSGQPAVVLSESGFVTQSRVPGTMAVCLLHGAVADLTSISTADYRTPPSQQRPRLGMGPVALSAPEQRDLDTQLTQWADDLRPIPR